jgi:peptidoglycan hydrolase-like protein with peptidoglycan-binding domain
MTPFRMRLCVVVFVAVAAAISINALYLQQGPRIAGAAVSSAAPAAQEAIAGEAATSSLPKTSLGAPAENRAETLATGTEAAERPSAPRTAAKPAPAKLVKAIQRELADRGYGVGEDNGVPGLQTRGAIVAYEFDEHLPLTGEPSEALLKSLIFGRAAGKGGPGPAERFERRRRLVTEVQEALATLRYRSGPADGRLSPETREAIRKFENDRRLQAGGRLTERVLLELVIVTGRPLEANG